jgi:hypothetical protein
MSYSELGTSGTRLTPLLVWNQRTIEMDVNEAPSWAQQYWGDEEEDESEDEFGDGEVDEEGSGRDKDERKTLDQRMARTVMN